jgi:hypothetical protein
MLISWPLTKPRKNGMLLIKPFGRIRTRNIMRKDTLAQFFPTDILYARNARNREGNEIRISENNSK